MSTTTVRGRPARGWAALAGPLSGVSFVAGVAGAVRLARAPFPRPGASGEDIRRYYTDSARAAEFSLSGQAVSVASLALFTRTAVRLAREGRPGSRALPLAVGVSGAASTLLLTGSALTGARLLRSPDRPDEELRHLARRAFDLGGPWHGVAYGVFTALLARGAADAGALASAGEWVGRGSALAGVAGPLYFRWEQAGWLIPIGRFSGYLVSGLVGVRVARRPVGRWTQVA